MSIRAKRKYGHFSATCFCPLTKTVDSSPTECDLSRHKPKQPRASVCVSSHKSCSDLGGV